MNNVTAGRSRREFLSTGAKAATALSGAVALGSCSSSSADDYQHRRGPVDLDYSRTENPFGVQSATPLEVVIFKGGYSEEYATEGHQPMYKKKFPDAKILHTGIEQISEAVRQRFDNFEPPDVLMNAGGERMDINELVERDLLLDLRVLFDAPSIDAPDTKVADTLRKGAVTNGQFGTSDEVWALPYSYSVYGLWFSQKLFDQKGWKKPETWPEFLDLCSDIKSDGLAPLAHPGRYPSYMMDPIISLAVQLDGTDVIKKIVDDFDKKAWTQDSLGEAAEAWEEFVKKGYVLEGCENLDHLHAQGKWAKGEAVFAPCGSWLENEEKDALPKDFDLNFMPLPALEGSSSPGMVQGNPGDHFVVPKYANNPAGGLEYLRMMLSKQGTNYWIDYTASLSSYDMEVKTDKPGVKAMAPYTKKAKMVYANSLEVEHDTFVNATLYPAIGNLTSGESNADQFLNEVVKGL